MSRSSLSKRNESDFKSNAPHLTTTTTEKNNESNFQYPDCWQDDERMQVLMTQFRDRQVNPLHYDVKMKFWQDLIAKFCEHYGQVTFSKTDLALHFSRGRAQPKGLDVVINELLRQKKLRLYSEYREDPENTWMGWASRVLIRGPLTWGWQRVKAKIVSQEAEPLDQEYIHLEVLNKLSQKLWEFLVDAYANKLVNYESLRKFLKTAPLTLREDTLHLSLHMLESQHKITIKYKGDLKNNQIEIVKIASKDANGNVLATITQAELAVYNLELAQENLVKQIESLEEEIEAHKDKALECIKNKRRQLAKVYLRRKKHLEQNLEKLGNSLNNLDVMLLKLQETGQYGEVLDALRIGSNALKSILSESEMTIDNVHKVTDEIQDTMEDFKELEDTMASLELQQNPLSDEETVELENELETMLREAEAESSTKEIGASPSQTAQPENGNAQAEELLHKILPLPANSPKPTPTMAEIDESLLDLEKLSLT